MFAKKPTPEEQAKEWSRAMTREMRTVERQIKSMDTEEQKVIREIKKLAKEGTRNDKAVRILAKQLVQSRQAKARLYEGKAQMHSVQLQLHNQMAMVKVTGAISKSTEIMAAVGKLVKLPELQATMMQLAKEMEKAGLTEEIMTDAMDDVSALLVVRHRQRVHSACILHVHCTCTH